MAAASTSVSGYLTFTDWNTFNNKASSTGFYNADGGFYNSVYGGTTALDAGSP
jgi:hypothetical protein